MRKLLTFILGNEKKIELIDDRGLNDVNISGEEINQTFSLILIYKLSKLFHD